MSGTGAGVILTKLGSVEVLHTSYDGVSTELMPACCMLSAG